MQQNRYTPPRRPPIGLALAAALAALILVGAIVGWLIWEFQQLPPGVAAALRIALFALPLAGAVELGVIVWRRWGSHKYIEAYHVTRLTRAHAQRFPESLQHLSYSHHDSSKPIAPMGQTEPPLLPAPGTSIPSFGQLLDSGRIAPNAPLILGFDAVTGEALAGSWRDLYSCGIGGLQGSGKTWAAVYLLCQSALQGGRLVICDPHAADSESLAARIAPLASVFLCDAASSDRDILAALRLADDKLQRRKKGHAARWPIVVACDEWLALRRGQLADVLPALVEDFSTEGRKLNCHMLLMAQRWDKAALGDFRNTLVSSYVYRMRRQEAAMMTGLPAGAGLPDDTLSLAPGQAYLLTTRGDVRKVVIPQMTAADVQRVAALVEAIDRPGKPPIGFRVPASAPLPITPAARAIEGADRRSDEGAAVQAPSTATARAKSYTPEQARALALFRGGMGIHDVVKEVWQVQGGTKYQQRAAELNSLIRQALAEEG